MEREEGRRYLPNGTGLLESKDPTSCPNAREVNDDKVKAKNKD